MQVYEGQNIRDICMAAYGSINQLAKLVIDNDLQLGTIPKPGTELVVDEDLGNATIKSYYTRNKIVPSSDAKYDEYYIELESGEYIQLDSGEFIKLNN